MLIGICDDNTNEAEKLRTLCEELGYSDTCIYSSGNEFLEAENKPNLLFLDIQMKGMSGIELKDFLEQTNQQTYIVFYTAHGEWMPDAFGKNVIGFLRKPVKLHEVERFIKKAVFLRKEYCILSLDSKVQLYCGQVLYIQANGVYTIFVCDNDQSYSVRKPLQKWANELEEYGFYATHRSYIVNFQHIENIDGKKVILKNGQNLPISRRHAKQTKNAYQQYCLSRLM